MKFEKTSKANVESTRAENIDEYEMTKVNFKQISPEPNKSILYTRESRKMRGEAFLYRVTNDRFQTVIKVSNAIKMYSLGYCVNINTKVIVNKKHVAILRPYSTTIGQQI